PHPVGTDLVSARRSRRVRWSQPVFRGRNDPAEPGLASSRYPGMTASPCPSRTVTQPARSGYTRPSHTTIREHRTMITQLHRPIASRLRGTWTALITPFDDGELNLATLRALIEHQIASGVDGLLVCGSTGEASSLTDDEYRHVIETAAATASGRVPVMAGTGTNSTATTIARTRLAHSLGVDAALVVAPWYNRPTQAGLIAHMEAVAAATPLPIVLYNVP